jgi:hypothetical protein
MLRVAFAPADIVCGCIGTTTAFCGYPWRNQDIPLADAQSNHPLEELHMQKLALIAGTLAILSIPALAGPATSDKPMVVAEEGGVSVRVGDRDHDGDRDRHHKVVVIKHRDHDEDHHKVVLLKHRDHDDDHRKVLVVKHHDHDHGDHDHDSH